MRKDIVKVVSSSVMRYQTHLDKVSEVVNQLEVTKEFIEKMGKELNDEKSRLIYRLVLKELDKALINLQGMLKDMPEDYQNNSVDLVSDLMNLVLGSYVNK